MGMAVDSGHDRALWIGVGLWRHTFVLDFNKSLWHYLTTQQHSLCSPRFSPHISVKCQSIGSQGCCVPQSDIHETANTSSVPWLYKTVLSLQSFEVNTGVVVPRTTMSWELMTDSSDSPVPMSAPFRYKEARVILLTQPLFFQSHTTCCPIHMEAVLMLGPLVILIRQSLFEPPLQATQATQSVESAGEIVSSPCGL